MKSKTKQKSITDLVAAVQAEYAHLSDDELLAELERSGKRCKAADVEEEAAYDERARLFLASRAPTRQLTMIVAAAAADVSDTALSLAIDKFKAKLRKAAATP